MLGQGLHCLNPFKIPTLQGSPLRGSDRATLVTRHFDIESSENKESDVHKNIVSENHGQHSVPKSETLKSIPVEGLSELGDEHLMSKPETQEVCWLSRRFVSGLDLDPKGSFHSDFFINEKENVQIFPHLNACQHDSPFLLTRPAK